LDTVLVRTKVQTQGFAYYQTTEADVSRNHGSWTNGMSDLEYRLTSCAVPLCKQEVWVAAHKAK
jgi:hypothetical protein